MNNSRKRPRINPVVRFLNEHPNFFGEVAVLQARLIAAEHTSNLALARVMTIHRRLQCQLQQGVWDEV